MPMLAIFPRSNQPGRLPKGKVCPQHRGYTLVELLVVLLIVGLMASVAIPNLQHLYRSVERDAQREAAIGAITSLSFGSYITGYPITLAKGRSDATAVNRAIPTAPDAEEESVFPAGWQLDLPEPIAFNFLGLCTGGKLILVAPDGSEEAFLLRGPRCDVLLPPDAS